jgi:hypothetical protein
VVDPGRTHPAPFCRTLSESTRLPTHQDQLLAWREALEEDLRALLRELEEGGAGPEGVVPDPLYQLGGTLFHLAHQGYDDRALQVNACPALSNGLLEPKLTRPPPGRIPRS